MKFYLQLMNLQLVSLVFYIWWCLFVKFPFIFYSVVTESPPSRLIYHCCSFTTSPHMSLVFTIHKCFYPEKIAIKLIEHMHYSFRKFWLVSEKKVIGSDFWRVLYLFFKIITGQIYLYQIAGLEQMSPIWNLKFLQKYGLS